MKIITFEGIHGSGKGTQLEYLRKWYLSRSISVTTTKEPYSLGASVRRLLTERNKLDHMTKLYLFQADRNENIQKNILPAIQRGDIVLCDRYIDSTVAYQQYGHQISEKIVKGLNNLTTSQALPNITFLLDVSIAVCEKRNETVITDKLRHKHQQDFLTRVRNGYAQIARDNPDRIIVINGDRSPETVHNDIVTNLLIRS